MEDVPLQEERFLRELNLVAKPAVDESQTKANVATRPAVVSLQQIQSLGSSLAWQGTGATCTCTPHARTKRRNKTKYLKPKNQSNRIFGEMDFLKT